MVRANDDPSHATRGWMALFYKSLGRMMMCGFATREELYKAVTRVCSNLALVTRTKLSGLYYQRLGRASYVVLQKSAEHVHGVKRTKLEEVGECEACGMGKSTRVSKTTVLYEECEAAKLLEQVFSDLVDPMKHFSIGKSRYFVTLRNSYSG